MAPRLSRWLFSRLVSDDAAEFVIGDLDEQAAARARSGESGWRTRAWYRGQLARSLPHILVGGVRARRARVSRTSRLATAGRVIRDGASNLVRSPGRALAVIAVMALGVGANATMFGALDRLFLRPPAHVEDPDAVRRVFVDIRRLNSPERVVQATQTYPDYRDLTEIDVFESVAAYEFRHLTEGTGEAAQRIPTTIATASFFELLGVRPVLGRLFDETDDDFAAEPVAVLGHGFWQRRFGGRDDAIGQTLHVGDRTYTIVGVTPPGFTGVDLAAVDVWLPLHPAGMVEEGGTEWVEARGWYWIQTIARLAPGVSIEQAAAAATLAHRNARAERAGYVERDPAVLLESLILARTTKASAEARVVPWVMGVALMVLLLTCANVANLLLASGLRRQRATAVRTALGASRARLVGTVVAEATLMALLGGIAAVLVAVWGGDVLRAIAFPGVEWAGGADAVRILLFGGGLALAAGLLMGILPATSAGGGDPAAALHGSGRASTRGRSRLRAGLLVAQAAISVMLLIGTGLFVRSLAAARAVDLGFEPEGVLLVTLQQTGPYPGGEEMTDLYRRSLAEVESTPGVLASAVATTVPFHNTRGIGSDLRVPGLDSLPVTEAGGAYINAVTGGYFEASGTRIVRGRGIRSTDDAVTAPRVAVVNETMARLVWPGSDAIGECLIIREAPCATIVGIAADSRRYELDESESMQYYVPLAHSPYPWPPRALLIRTADPVGLAPVVQRTLNESLAGVRLVGTSPFREAVDPTFRSWQLGATLFSTFGLLALLVASVGLYSVLAFDIADRRREMGLRAALGATHGRLMRLVVGDGLRLAGLGVAIGVGAGVLLAPFARDLLFGVSPRDPWVMAAVAIAMLSVSAVACWLPAWRASRVDPNETLRAE